MQAHAPRTPRLTPSVSAAIISWLGIAVLVGCTVTPNTPDPTITPNVKRSPVVVLEAEGARAVVAAGEESAPGDALFEGTISLTDGCWALHDDEGSQFPVRWPHGTTLASGGLVLPDGSAAAVGTRVALGGGATSGASLAFDSSGCWSDTAEVIVAASATLSE